MFELFNASARPWATALARMKFTIPSHNTALTRRFEFRSPEWGSEQKVGDRWFSLGPGICTGLPEPTSLT